MSIDSILNFSIQVFGMYASSNVWYYLVLPVFALGIIICLIRVVKFLVSNNF